MASKQLTVLGIATPLSRGSRDVCPYCSRSLEPRRTLCPSCGKRPFVHEARLVLMGLAGLSLAGSLLIAPWRVGLFALTWVFAGAGLYLMSRREIRQADNRYVFLPLAALMFALIPIATGSVAAGMLAGLATAFAYFALPALHSPASEDLSRSIEEFEAQNQLGYGFGTIREQIRATIAASENAKRGVLGRELLPRIDRLLDERLLAVLKRKVSLERIMATTDPSKLEEERRKAIDRASLIKSDAVRGELARSAALSKAMIENYQKIAELLNVYNVQVRNLQKVLLNLNMKVAASAFNDGGLDTIREPLDALDHEVEFLEKSFRELDLLMP
ncbi:MAG: hypothetical protein HY816_18605 [Candidatus Wallbacteria bacterium]|nr:hypothetical protein [Candidatus Wallbacteria bacterium]